MLFRSVIYLGDRTVSTFNFAVAPYYPVLARELPNHAAGIYRDGNVVNPIRTGAMYITGTRDVSLTLYAAGWGYEGYGPRSVGVQSMLQIESLDRELTYNLPEAGSGTFVSYGTRQVNYMWPAKLTGRFRVRVLVGDVWSDPRDLEVYLQQQ